MMAIRHNKNNPQEQAHIKQSKICYRIQRTQLTQKELVQLYYFLRNQNHDSLLAFFLSKNNQKSSKMLLFMKKLAKICNQSSELQLKSFEQNNLLRILQQFIFHQSKEVRRYICLILNILYQVNQKWIKILLQNQTFLQKILLLLKIDDCSVKLQILFILQGIFAIQTSQYMSALLQKHNLQQSIIYCLSSENEKLIGAGQLLLNRIMYLGVELPSVMRAKLIDGFVLEGGVSILMKLMWFSEDSRDQAVVILQNVFDMDLGQQ